MSFTVGYTRLVMCSRFLAIALALLVPAFVKSQANQGTPTPPQALETGKILPRIQCTAHPEQSYALYLPSTYSPGRAWPLIISSDPAARGTVPLELEKDAAERLGYVLVASNNSRNGPWKPRLEATEAMLNDVQVRVSVDTRGIYFAGFSGGARASSQFASLCKCSAGVLLSGAGFSNGFTPAADSPFPVFSAVGTLDFNYKEIIPLQETLAKTGYPHWLRVFDGIHQWPPAEVMEEALVWFRIQAMKSDREPRGQSFIEAEYSKARARASSLEQSGDLLGAWREYLQIVGTYDSLLDVGPLREKAESLGKAKSVREALKREKNEFEQEARLTADIVSRLAASQGTEDTRYDARNELRQEIFQLRQDAEHEKRPEIARVFKRALGGVFVTFMESGSSLLDSKKYTQAIVAFDCATQALPESEWAWSQLAVAYAVSSQKKETMNAIRRARDAVSDKAAFQKWLETDPAFEFVRSTPEFQSLLKAN